MSGITEYKSTAAVPLVTSIVLPDSSQYTFTYEPTPATPSSGACTPYAGTTCVTARITKITLPTGGIITYGYSGGAGTNGSGICSDGSAATLTRTSQTERGLMRKLRVPARLLRRRSPILKAMSQRSNSRESTKHNAKSQACLRRIPATTAPPLPVSPRPSRRQLHNVLQFQSSPVTSNRSMLTRTAHMAFPPRATITITARVLRVRC